MAQILNYPVAEGRVTQMTDTRIAVTPVQKVVVVNGNTEVLGMLETVLDAGRYDMVFVEASAHAYTRIKNVQPHLIILCMRLDDADAFNLLSMLKLDEDTRRIPIVTYAQEFDAFPSDGQDDEVEDSVEEFPRLTTSVTMN